MSSFFVGNLRYENLNHKQTIAAKTLVKEVEQLPLGDQTMTLFAMDPRNPTAMEPAFGRTAVSGCFRVLNSAMLFVVFQLARCSTVVLSVIKRSASEPILHVFRDMIGRFGVFPFILSDCDRKDIAQLQVHIIADGRVLGFVANALFRTDMLQLERLGTLMLRLDSFIHLATVKDSPQITEAFINNMRSSLSGQMTYPQYRDISVPPHCPDISKAKSMNHHDRLRQLLIHAHSINDEQFSMSFSARIRGKERPGYGISACRKLKQSEEFWLNKNVVFAITLKLPAGSSVAFSLREEATGISLEQQTVHDVPEKFSLLPFMNAHKAGHSKSLILEIIMIVGRGVFRFTATTNRGKKDMEAEDCESLDIRDFLSEELPDASPATVKKYFEDARTVRPLFFEFDPTFMLEQRSENSRNESGEFPSNGRLNNGFTDPPVSNHPYAGELAGYFVLNPLVSHPPTMANPLVSSSSSSAPPVADELFGYPMANPLVSSSSSAPLTADELFDYLMANPLASSSSSSAPFMDAEEHP